MRRSRNDNSRGDASDSVARSRRTPPLLTRFQRHGDIDALITLGVSTGLDEARLRTSIRLLAPVLERLNFGESPAYEDLEPSPPSPELTFILRAMTRSPTADMRIAGLRSMARLGCDEFIEDLRAVVVSRHEWERIEALHALADMRQLAVRPILISACAHTDLLTARVAAEALDRFDAGQAALTFD
jgi:hypothetical protein